MTTTRVEQIEEAMNDLEAVFADPTCFRSPGSIDSRPVQDYAESLASEFVGEHPDEEIVAGVESSSKPRTVAEQGTPCATSGSCVKR